MIRQRAVTAFIQSNRTTANAAIQAFCLRAANREGHLTREMLAAEREFNCNFDHGGASVRIGLPKRDFRNVLSSESIARGAGLKPEGHADQWGVAADAANIFRRACQVVQFAVGDPITWPSVDDTDNEATPIAEDQSPTTIPDPEFSVAKVALRRFWTGLVPAAMELVEDSPNFVSQIFSVLGTRCGRGHRRLVTQNILKPQAVAATAPGSASVLSGDDIDNAIGALSPEAIETAALMMHPGTYLHLRKLKDGNGAAVFEKRNLELGGFPVLLNPSMDTIATGNTSVIAGDFAGSLVVVERPELTLFESDERYIDRGQVGFAAIYRASAAILGNSDAYPKFTKLVHP